MNLDDSILTSSVNLLKFDSPLETNQHHFSPTLYLVPLIYSQEAAYFPMSQGNPNWYSPYYQAPPPIPNYIPAVPSQSGSPSYWPPFPPAYYPYPQFQYPPYYNQGYPNTNGRQPNYRKRGGPYHGGNRNSRRDSAAPYAQSQPQSKPFKCKFDNCNFKASSQDELDSHHSKQHSAPVAIPGVNIVLDTPEAIEQWISERKRRFPTKERILEKSKDKELHKQNQPGPKETHVNQERPKMVLADNPFARQDVFDALQERQRDQAVTSILESIMFLANNDFLKGFELNDGDMDDLPVQEIS